jgi:hypothetical protein
LGVLAAAFAGTLGCSGTEAPESEPETWQNLEQPSVLELERNLSRGDSGPDVRALHGFLTRYGYLYNQALAEADPNWEPIVRDLPASTDAFDTVTEEAVRMYQELHALPAHGMVDLETRNRLRLPRCGSPDSATRLLDDSMKWAHYSGSAKWTGASVTWQMFSYPPGLSTSEQAAYLQAIQRATVTWHNASALNVNRSTTGTAQILVTFYGEDAPASWPDCDFTEPGGIVGCAKSPTGGRVGFDENEAWYTGTSNPPGASPDLESIALHEFGHALGLSHSSVSTAVMFPDISLGQKLRVLTQDDKIAYQALYDTWAQISGIAARDIAFGPDDVPWVVASTGTNGIVHKYTGGRWVGDYQNGAGVRIAVDANSRPWVVTSANNVYRQNSSGSWSQISGAKATDIGAGGGAIWIIGDQSQGNGNYNILQWNGSSFVATTGAAKRIAVDKTGKPWVVTGSGNVFRRSGSSWSSVPGLSATDIGAGSDGSVWATGTAAVPGGYGIYVWSEQTALYDSDGNVIVSNPQRWVQVSGGGVNIAVTSAGRPWVTNSSSQVFQRHIFR